MHCHSMGAPHHRLNTPMAATITITALLSSGRLCSSSQTLHLSACPPTVAPYCCTVVPHHPCAAPCRTVQFGVPPSSQCLPAVLLCHRAVSYSSAYCLAAGLPDRTDVLRVLVDNKPPPSDDEDGMGGPKYKTLVEVVVSAASVPPCIASVRVWTSSVVLPAQTQTQACPSLAWCTPASLRP